jgi:hypothetical protein
MQQVADILLLQYSTCFGLRAPIIRSIKNTDAAATGKCSYGNLIITVVSDISANILFSFCLTE